MDARGQDGQSGITCILCPRPGIAQVIHKQLIRTCAAASSSSVKAGSTLIDFGCLLITAARASMSVLQMPERKADYRGRDCNGGGERGAPVVPERLHLQASHRAGDLRQVLQCMPTWCRQALG